jgi:hypothetical protein
VNPKYCRARVKCRFFGSGSYLCALAGFNGTGASSVGSPGAGLAPRSTRAWVGASSASNAQRRSKTLIKITGAAVSLTPPIDETYSLVCRAARARAEMQPLASRRQRPADATEGSLPLAERRREIVRNGAYTFVGEACSVNAGFIARTSR